MKKIIRVKIIVVAVFLTICSFGLFLLPKAEMQKLNQNNVSERKLGGISEIKGYQNWTKVNDKPQIMRSEVAVLCRMPTTQDLENDIHNNKYINVFVNNIGKDEMLTKKNPVFPKGTVIVKQKLPTLESNSPELLTVMIKRRKGFNPSVGDWEFFTSNGAATETTARGKLESCQRCHVEMKTTDYISRNYLPDEIKAKLEFK